MVQPTRRLSDRMKRVNVHWIMKLSLYGGDIVAMELVGCIDTLCVPICPVDLILKESNGEWVRKT